jgi:uncharacterized protein
MTDLNQALTAEELDELSDFLAQPDMEDRSMDLSMLEGYLTAILIGPRVVMPSQWLPWVWDADEGQEEAVFADLDQANRIMGLLMRFLNGIVQTFLTDPAAFEPIYWRGAQWGAAEWCEGFLLGTQFDREAWAGLWVIQPTWVTPFLRLGTETGINSTKNESNAEQWMQAVAPTLIKIHAFWKERRQAVPAGIVEDDFGFGRQRTPAVRATSKVGRNEPCPCGSGKKFKKCCGSTSETAPPGPHLH